MRRLLLRRSLIAFVLLVVIAGCGSSDDGSEPAQPGAGNDAAGQSVDLAPELAGINNWFNTDPLTLQALRGSPVLLVFFRDT